MKKISKLIIGLTLVVAMLGGIVNAETITENIEPMVNGTLLERYNTFIEDGVTYVDADTVLNGLGNGGFEWLTKNKLELVRGKDAYIFTAGSKEVVKIDWDGNESIITLPIAPRMVNGKPYFPLRALVELIYKGQVSWKYEDGKHKINITVQDNNYKGL